MRPLLVALLLAVAGLCCRSDLAAAHALAQSSDPPAGAELDRPPPTVTVTFSEAPDPGLSQMHVLDVAGRPVERSAAHAKPGNPAALQVDLPALPQGIYTVSWQTVSAVDGHVASASFAFGIGLAPAMSPQVNAESNAAPPAVGIAGHWLLIIGLCLMLGGAWVAALAFPTVALAQVRLLDIGWITSVVGLVLFTGAQYVETGVPWDTFAISPLGDALNHKLVALIFSGVALLAIEAWREAPLPWRSTGQRVALLLIGCAASIAMLFEATASHAASGHGRLLMVLAQWGHVFGVGVWIGGLAALLVGVRGAPDGTKGEAVRRFSKVAGFALVIVATTGFVRAADEIGALSNLTATFFGHLVVVKVGLLAILAAFGALNHFRNVPRASRSLQSLRRVGGIELALAALGIGVSAVLVSLAPPSFTPAMSEAARPHLQTDGSDYGTTVRAHLEASPGFPGANHFALHLIDYDTGRMVAADHVTLHFAVPGRPSVGGSTLDLRRESDGSYAGDGANLSLLGDWAVTVVVQRGADSVQVPLAVSPLAPKSGEPPTVLAQSPRIH